MQSPDFDTSLSGTYNLIHNLADRFCGMRVPTQPDSRRKKQVVLCFHKIPGINSAGPEPCFQGLNSGLKKIKQIYLYKTGFELPLKLKPLVFYMLSDSVV